MGGSTLERIAAGDSGAVQECLDQFGGLVWSIARRWAATSQDAEDAVQEVFLDVWKHAGRFDPTIGSEATFVATIARRRLLDQRRRASRRIAPEPLAEADDVPAETADASADLRDEAARVLSALGSLEGARRRVVELSVRDGFSHERIAEALGIPLGTVKSHARRGLMQLRELLSRTRVSTAEGTS